MHVFLYITSFACKLFSKPNKHQLRASCNSDQNQCQLDNSLVVANQQQFQRNQQISPRKLNENKLGILFISTGNNTMLIKNKSTQ